MRALRAAGIGVRPDLVSDPGTAATFAGAIAAATLAFVAVVFVATLAAIQLAASQYSRWTLRIFIPGGRRQQEGNGRAEVIGGADPAERVKAVEASGTA